MATADASTEENDVECTVCQELFTEPKVLPCAHTLCRHCLLTWLTSSKEGNCPSCRSVIIAASQRAEGLEKAVAVLPNDSSMAALVRCKRLLSEDQLCGGCGQPAVSICLHCSDMLCTTCTTAHRNLKATRQHKVQDLSSMTAEKLSVSQPVICCVHSGRPAELYCPTHGAAICHLCSSTEHRACSEPTLFEDHAEELRKELSSISQTLKTTEEKLDRAIKELDQQLQEAEKKAEQSIAEIDKAFDRLDRSMKDRRCCLKERVLKSKKKLEDSVKNTRFVFTDRQGRIRSHRRIVDRVKSISPSGELDEATLTIKSCLKEVDMKISLDSSATHMTTLMIDEQALTNLERELSSLAQEKIVETIPKPSAWRFHPNRNVAFTNGGTTVEKVMGQTAILISSTPMMVNMLYEVQIDETKGRAGDYFPCGVVTSEPAKLFPPTSALRGWKDAIVFSNGVYKFEDLVITLAQGMETGWRIEKKLQGLTKGTRVGFVLDADGFLHLFINGKKQWVFVRDAPKTCYVFFELLHCYQKVTILPITNMRQGRLGIMEERHCETLLD